MNKVFSIILGVIGAVLLAIGLPVYDMIVGQAWIEGGLLSMVLFLTVLLTGGFVLLIFAVYVWRKQ